MVSVRSPVGYRGPALYVYSSRILPLLPQHIPAFFTPAFYMYSVPHSCILPTLHYPSPNPKTDPNRLTPTLTLKVEIMYAVQNDTEIKFNIVL